MGTNPGVCHIVPFQSWDFPALWSGDQLFSLPDLCWFPDKFGPSQPQEKSFASNMCCGVDWAFLPATSIQPMHIGIELFGFCAFLGGFLLKRAWLFHLMHHAHLGASAAASLLPYKLWVGAMAIVLIIPEWGGWESGPGRTILKVPVLRCHVLVAETGWIQSYNCL